MYKLLLCAVISSVILLSCDSISTGVSTPQGTDSPASAPHDTTTVKYAKSFTIGYRDNYKIVHIFNRINDRIDTLEYLLLPNKAPIPTGHAHAQIIRIPVQSMVVMASPHIGQAEAVGVGDRITGLGSFAFINSERIRSNIKAGKVKEVGQESNLNNELLITMHPGFLMVSSNPDAGSGKFKILMDAGIPVIMNADWLETTPLGKAEWIKLMAALVDKEAPTNKTFDSIETRYNELAKIGAATTTKPRTIISMPYKGTWFIPAGESYMAHFLHDAGAGYKWSDTKGVGSLSLNFESVVPEALEADFWLNIGFVDSKQEITANDQRFSSFKSFKTGKLYNNTARTNDIGSNDYWESGAVNPHVVLEDMINILHPGLLPDHKLVYYKQLK